MKDTMEAEMRLLFDWCAGRSKLKIMAEPPVMQWDDCLEQLLCKTDDCRIEFSVEVIRGRTRREEASIRLIEDDGSRITETFMVPAEISAAALALRGVKA